MSKRCPCHIFHWYSCICICKKHFIRILTSSPFLDESFIWLAPGLEEKHFLTKNVNSLIQLIKFKRFFLLRELWLDNMELISIVYMEYFRHVFKKKHIKGKLNLILNQKFDSSHMNFLLPKHLNKSFKKQWKFMWHFAYPLALAGLVLFQDL